MKINPLKHLSADSLIDFFFKFSHKIPENRTKNKYSLSDATMSVLAMFMFKSPSLLSFQEKMQKDYNRNNLNTVFHVKNIPSDNQIRNILDNIHPDSFNEIYHEISRRITKEKFKTI